MVPSECEFRPGGVIVLWSNKASFYRLHVHISSNLRFYAIQTNQSTIVHTGSQGHSESRKSSVTQHTTRRHSQPIVCCDNTTAGVQDNFPVPTFAKYCSFHDRFCVHHLPRSLLLFSFFRASSDVWRSFRGLLK